MTELDATLTDEEVLELDKDPVLSVKITNKDKKEEEFPDEEFTVPEYITEAEIKEFEDA